MPAYAVILGMRVACISWSVPVLGRIKARVLAARRRCGTLVAHLRDDVGAGHGRRQRQLRRFGRWPKTRSVLAVIHDGADHRAAVVTGAIIPHPHHRRHSVRQRRSAVVSRREISRARR